jgi:hypothetical protein
VARTKSTARPMTSEELVAAGLSPNKEDFHDLVIVKTGKLDLRISLVPKRILQMWKLVQKNLLMRRGQNYILQLSCLVN